MDKKALLDDLFAYAPPMESEDDCAENIVVPFLVRLGYDRRQIQRKVSIKSTTGETFRRQADVIVSVDDVQAMVVETKRLSHRLKEEDANQGLAYAQLLDPPAPVAVVTNGRDWEVYRLDSDQIGDIQAVPEPDELKAEVRKSAGVAIGSEQRDSASRLLHTLENKDQLEAAFRTCRKALAREGLIAESAFDELTKILVCKFNEEKMQAEGIARFRFTSAWLEGEGPVSALNVMFTDAKKRFHVFDSGARIEIRSNETALEIVRALEKFGFYGFKTPLGLAGAGGDVVGSVYETFLTGTLRGDLGQYLTPRSIIEFMVNLADIDIGDRILDMSAGSGGFLIRSFLDVRKQIRSLEVEQNEKDELVGNLVQNHLWGIEINSRLATLCRINMVLHGDGYEHIYTGDGIRDAVFRNTDGRDVDFERIEQGELPKFDVILMNPPFNLPYEDAKVLNRYELGRGRTSQGSDFLMLERALRVLKPETGRLLMILPHGVASGTAEAGIRDYVRQQAHVHGCISLPVGTFKPFGGSNARTCVLYLRKVGDARGRFLAQAEQVGYDISTKTYRPIEDNDLPAIAESYHAVKETL